MAKTLEINLNQIYEMLNRIKESNQETESKLTEINCKLDDTKVELIEKSDGTNNKLEETRAEINNKIEDVKLDLSIKINDTNFKLDQSIDKDNQQLKEVVDTVIDIETRCAAMNNKIYDRCKSLELTLKKAFTEQVTRMNNKMIRHFSKCETRITAVQADCESLDTAVTQNKRSINRLENVVKDNERETSAHSDKFKIIAERFEKFKREFHFRSTPTVIYHGHVDDKERITFRGNRFENPIEFIKLCEREMDSVGCDLADSERLDWVARHLKNSARQWFNIIWEKINTYDDLKQMMENRYWNLHIQSQINTQRHA